jgi:pimeloyl-ACP methyl ester carboxylesterase
LDNVIAVGVKPGGFMESQSGIQRRNPTIFCRLVAPDARPDTAYVLVHPTSNFHNHYLAAPLVKRGVAVFMVNTRFVANDTMLLMERAIQDLGAAVRHLREAGFKRVVLVGNSGGGSLAALYQQQAERLTIASTPDGRAFVLSREDLPPADALAMTCAHPGRAEQLLSKIDPAVRDEHDPEATDSELDMYARANRPPYPAEWLQRYRREQAARLRRITDWVVARLAKLEAARASETADEAFLVHRTQADPRLLDLSLDPNDRVPGSIQGQAIHANYSSNGLARFCTLRSFLSQWSPWHSRAHGPKCLAETSVPVLVVNHTADQTVFPSHIDAWIAAAGARGTRYDLKGAPHYADDRPELVEELCDLLVEWGR